MIDPSGWFDSPAASNQADTGVIDPSGWFDMPDEAQIERDARALRSIERSGGSVQQGPLDFSASQPNEPIRTANTGPDMSPALQADQPLTQALADEQLPSSPARFPTSSPLAQNAPRARADLDLDPDQMQSVAEQTAGLQSQLVPERNGTLLDTLAKGDIAAPEGFGQMLYATGTGAVAGAAQGLNDMVVQGYTEEVSGEVQARISELRAEGKAEEAENLAAFSGSQEFMRMVGSPLEMVADFMTGQSNKAFDRVAEARPDNAVGGYLYDVQSGLAQMAAPIAATVLTRGRNAIKSADTGLMTMSGQIFLTEYNSNRDAGETPQEAANGAFKATASEVGPEMAFGVFDRLKIPGLMNRVKQMGAEAAAEFTTSIWQQFDELAETGEPMSFVEAAYSASVGAGMGVLMSGNGQARTAPPEPENPVSGLNPLDRLPDQVGASLVNEWAQGMAQIEQSLQSESPAMAEGFSAAAVPEMLEPETVPESNQENSAPEAGSLAEKIRANLGADQSVAPAVSQNQEVSIDEEIKRLTALIDETVETPAATLDAGPPAELIMRNDGKPYRSRAAAEKRRSKNGGLGEVVEVENGFAVSVPGVVAQELPQVEADQQVQPEPKITDPVLRSQLPENFDDPRLMRAMFRSGLVEMQGDLTKGGGIALPPKDDGPGMIGSNGLRIPGSGGFTRTSSVNPRWFQSMAVDTGITVEGFGRAVDRALSGKKLGVRQKEAISFALSQLNAERMGAGGDGSPAFNSWQEMIEGYRDNQRAARGELTSSEINALSNEDNAQTVERLGTRYAAEEYAAEMDAESRALYDLAEDARAQNESATIEALQSESDDIALANQLWDIANGKQPINAADIQAATPASNRQPEAQQGQDAAASEARTEAGQDRRLDDATRTSVDQMTEAEMRQALLTDELTGLGNRRAFNEAIASHTGPVISIDADSLKWINDNMSPDTGDAMLVLVGEAIKANAPRGYHTSGDEFYILASGAEDASAIMGKVESALAGAELTYETDLEIVTKQGVNITYGQADSKQEADRLLKQEKESREQSGERSGRGQEPPGVSRQSARVPTEPEAGREADGQAQPLEGDANGTEQAQFDADRARQQQADQSPDMIEGDGELNESAENDDTLNNQANLSEPDEAGLNAGQKTAVPESASPSGVQSGWVIRERDTGDTVFETQSRSVAEKVNQDRYEVVPILKHLEELNDPSTKAYQSIRRENNTKGDGQAEGRYSRVGTRNLFVAHNLSESNLSHAFEIGGLAAPSLAIAKTDYGFDNFGEITLLAPSSILESDRARTFDADIYSPRHPRPEYTIDGPEFRRQVESLDNEYGFRVPSQDQLESEGVFQLANSSAYRYAWLKSQGKAPKPKRLKVDPAVRRIARLNLDAGSALTDPRVIKIATGHLSKIQTKRELDGARSSDKSLYFNEDGSPLESSLRQLISKAAAYNRAGGVDTYELESDIRKKLQPGRTNAAFEAWATEKFNELNKGARLFRGFTPAGNRQYSQYTLDNVVKQMVQGLRGGESWFYGVGSVRSSFANEMRTVASVQNRRGQILPESEVAKIKEESSDRMMEVVEQLTPHYKYDTERMGFIDAMAEAIATPSEWSESFDLNTESRAILKEFTDYLKNLPAEYFESKVRRAVDLSEFSIAVVPKGTPNAVTDRLRGKGMKIVRYDRSDPDSRKAVIAKQEDILFSKTQGSGGRTATVESITDSLAPRAKRALIDSGLITITDSPSQWPGSHPADAAGMWKDGKIYLAASNIEAGQERGLILHEVGVHHGLAEMMGDKYQPLINSLKRQVKRGSRSDAREADKQAYRAHQRALADDTLTGKNEAALWEETIAYMAESGANANFIQRVTAAIRDFLRKMGLVRGYSDADIAHLASGSVARIVDGIQEMDGSSMAPAMYKSGSTGRFDSANPDIRYSRKEDDQGAQKDIDSTFEASSSPQLQSDGSGSSGVRRLDNAPQPSKPGREGFSHWVYMGKDSNGKAVMLGSNHKSLDPKGNLERFWRKNLTKEGQLTEEAFARHIESDGLKNEFDVETQHLTIQFKRAARKGYGVRFFTEIPEADQRKMNDYLAGQDVDGIPGAVRKELDVLRQMLDNLSGKLQQVLIDEVRFATESMDAASQLVVNDNIEAVLNGDEVAIETVEALSRGKYLLGKLQTLATIEGNFGSYLNRSYRIFDDPKFTPSDAVIEKARAFLEVQVRESSENSDLTDDQIASRVNGIMKSILDRGAGSALDLFGSQLGQKDRSFLKKRKDIAPEIRALLGEYKDPRTNFARSSTKMAYMVAQHEFLKGVRKDGLGLFLSKRPEGSMSTEIAPWQDETMAPLAGLYATKDFAAALRDHVEPVVIEGWLKKLLLLNTSVKYGKTVLSPTTAMRNLISASMFTAMNGHFNYLHSLRAAQVVFHDMGGNQKAQLDYIKKLARLGVLHDNPNAGELRAAMDDVADMDATTGSLVGRGVKRTLNAATRFYRAGDDFWKVIGFENEKASFIKSGMTEAEAESMAADRIRNGYPTYSMVPEMIRAIRKFPAVGTFVSFPWEMIRTTGHQFRFMKEDVQAGRTAMAAKRAVGMTVAMAGANALRAASMAMLGLSEEDDEAIRELAAPWQKNSTFAYSGLNERGQIRYLDLTHLDPYSYPLKKVVMAVLNGNNEGFDEKATSAIWEFLSPFLSTEITFGTIVELWANSKLENDRPIYDRFAPRTEQAKQVTEHLVKNLSPGVVNNVWRTALALRGQVTSYGKEYSTQDELLAWAGFRMNTVDTQTSLRFRAFDFDDHKASAGRPTYRALRDLNEVSDRQLESAANQTIATWNASFHELHSAVRAAKVSGLEEREIMSILNDAGVAKKYLQATVNEQTPEFVMTRSAVRNAMSSTTGRVSISREEFDRRLKLLKVILREEQREIDEEKE